MKYAEESPDKRLLRVAEAQAVFRAKDLEDQGVPRSYLGRWVDEGRLERVGRGLYRLADRRFAT